MKRREGAVLSAFTGYMLCDFDVFHRYAEEIMERPIWTHEFGQESMANALKEKSTPEFMKIMSEMMDREKEDWEIGPQNFTDEKKAEGIRSMMDALPQDKPVILVMGNENPDDIPDDHTPVRVEFEK